jgi:hypothetical protein
MFKLGSMFFLPVPRCLEQIKPIENTLSIASEYFRNLGKRIAHSTEANRVCSLANAIIRPMTVQLSNLLTLYFGRGSNKSLWLHADFLPIPFKTLGVSSAKDTYCLKTFYR